MKRLVAITNGELEYMDISVDTKEAEDMILLKALDATEVKTGTCPQCDYSPLDNQEGYLVCKNCGCAYKVFDNEVYIVK